MPYPALYDLTNTAAVSRPHLIRNAFIRELSDATIEIILDFVNRATSPFSMIASAGVGWRDGARCRPMPPPSRYRDKAFYIAADSSWEEEPRPERHIAWSEAFWEAVAPYTDGAYAGFLGTRATRGCARRTPARRTPDWP